MEIIKKIGRAIFPPLNYAQRVWLIWGLSIVISAQGCIFWRFVKNKDKWMEDYKTIQYSSDDIYSGKAERGWRAHKSWNRRLWVD